MSRIISLVVGLYAGIVIDQNFQVPRLPTIPMEKIKKFFGSEDDNRRK